MNRDPSGNTITNLAALSGVPERRIYCIRKGYDRQEKNGKVHYFHFVEFTTADKLLLAMGMDDEWYWSLRDIYEATTTNA